MVLLLTVLFLFALSSCQGDSNDLNQATVFPYLLEHSFDLRSFTPRSAFEVTMQGDFASASIVGENVMSEDQLVHMKVD